MKIALLLVFLGFFPLTVNATGIEEVRLCLNSLPQQKPQDRDVAAEACYQLAKPFAYSKSLLGRFLYFRALVFRQRPDGEHSYQPIADKITAYYRAQLDKSLRHSDLRILPTKSLDEILVSLDLGLFYPSLVYVDPAGLKQMSRVFREIERRKKATVEQAMMVRNTLLQNSEWALSQKLTKRWPQLSPLPEFVNEALLLPEDLGYLSLSEDLTKLTLKRFPLQTGPKIVVNAFSDCPFAIEAFRELSTRTEFVTAMKNFGLVTTNANNTDYREIDSLRKQFPAFELHPLFKVGAWFQMMRISSSPDFRFLLNGKIEHSFSGSRSDLQENFCLGLSKIGLMDPAACK